MASEPSASDAAALVSSDPSSSAAISTFSSAKPERSNPFPISPTACSSSSFACSGAPGSESCAMKPCSVCVRCSGGTAPHRLLMHCAIDERLWRERGAGAALTTPSSSSSSCWKPQPGTALAASVANSERSDARAGPWSSGDWSSSSERGSTNCWTRGVVAWGAQRTMHTQSWSTRCVRCSSASVTSAASSRATLWYSGALIEPE
mmetsp:Transcript_47693/g.112553  ORF Transcript_47693/g.112553 Transcript_47693/m.112553 type:complete len:205 (+) Transcript_47693:1309-1923(+)